MITLILHMDNVNNLGLTAAASESGGAPVFQIRSGEMPPLTNISGNRTRARTKKECRWAQ